MWIQNRGQDENTEPDTRCKISKDIVFKKETCSLNGQSSMKVRIVTSRVHSFVGLERRQNQPKRQEIPQKEKETLFL